jgi:DNA-binding transcriptional LysR family regulator
VGAGPARQFLRPGRLGLSESSKRRARRRIYPPRGFRLSLDQQSQSACTNWELPIIWALQDQGLAEKSWWEVSEHVERGELETVLEAFEPDPVAFFAIHPVSVSQSAKNALFIDELLSDFRADPLP